MRETSKANRRRVHDPLWHKVFRGVGLDIGCGDDPVSGDLRFSEISWLDVFDKPDGDAGNILAHLPEVALVRRGNRGNGGLVLCRTRT